MPSNVQWKAIDQIALLPNLSFSAIIIFIYLNKQPFIHLRSNNVNYVTIFYCDINV